MSLDRVVVASVARREFGAGLRTALRWLAPLAGLLLLVCVLQPALANGPLATKIESMPALMRRAFGLELVDFHRPALYLAVNFTYVAVGVGLFGGLLGARAIAQEEALRTADLLFVAPVRRSRILVGKAIAVACYVIALPAVLGAIAIATLGVVVDRPLEPALLVSMFAATTCLGICFAGVGMFVATHVRDARDANGATLGIVFGSFVLGIVSALTPVTAPLRYLSPFKLLEAMPVVAGGGVPVLPALGCTLAGILLGAWAIARYERRDLHA